MEVGIWKWECGSGKLECGSGNGEGGKKEGEKVGRWEESEFGIKGKVHSAESREIEEVGNNTLAVASA